MPVEASAPQKRDSTDGLPVKVRVGIFLRSEEENVSNLGASWPSILIIHRSFCPPICVGLPSPLHISRLSLSP